MSNVFLFVYPDKRYFNEQEMDIAFQWGARAVFPYVMSFYDRLIRARYRNHGYSIYWLVYGSDNDPRVPDASTISHLLEVCPEDHIISAGISFGQLNGHLNLRADGSFVQSQLPNDVDRLVVAGFHERDCVDKLARYFYETAALDVMVDIDLTHTLPGRLACRIPVPDHRLSFRPGDFAPIVDPSESKEIADTWKAMPWRKQRRMYDITPEERQSAMIKPRTTVRVSGEPDFGRWEKAGKRDHAVYLVSDDGETSYGKVFALNGRVFALDYNRIPADATAEDADKYVVLKEFPDEHQAASWLAKRTKKSPRAPIRPRVKIG